MKTLLYSFNLLIITCLLSLQVSAQSTPFAGETIIIQAEDGVPVTADLYLIENTDAPYILLFHQATFSRGSYREIAPKLNALGFNCIAIDQRSGNRCNSIINETHKAAKKLNKETSYSDAAPDLIATINYALNEKNARKVIIWGSSYSAALTLMLAADLSDKIDGALAFSPGEYATLKSKRVIEYATNINCPVFITSAKKEQDNWKSQRFQLIEWPS